MAVSASVRLVEEMTAPINHILGAMTDMLGAMENIQIEGEKAFGGEAINSMRRHIETAQVEMQELSDLTNNTGSAIKKNKNEQENFNDKISEGSRLAENLFDKFKTGLGIIGAGAGIQKAMDFVSGSMDMFDTQLNSEVQLVTVLGNMIEDDIGGAYDSIAKKASEIQGRGIYGDEAMLAGAGELATYFTDPEAITSMMNTLANYTMGMTGGGEVGTEEMVNYATNLGKIMSGAYDGMTKKGFEFTDAQKAVIEGAATEAQYIESLGEDYVNMSEDMRAATVINDIIEESWSGLYDTMSDTPQGKIIQMKNAFGDLREEVGEQVYPSVMNVVGAITENAPQISEVVMGLATLIGIVVDVIGYAASAAGEVAGFFIDHWSAIAPVIAGIITVLAIYNGVLLLHKAYAAAAAAVKGALAVASFIHGTATAAETTAVLGLNAAMFTSIIVIVLIIAAIYAVVSAINKVKGTSYSATGFILGILNSAAAIIKNLFMGLLELIFGLIDYNINKFSAFANFLGNVFRDPVGSIIHLFGDMGDNVLGVIEKIAKAIDFVFGSNLADTVSGWRSSLGSMTENLAEKYGNGRYEEVFPKSDIENILSDLGINLQRKSIAQAWDDGYSAGEALDTYGLSLFSNKDTTIDDLLARMDGVTATVPDMPDIADIAETTSGIADDTSDIADKINMTDEDLKFLRDMAEREAVNQFTTAEVRVELGGVTNNLSPDMDIDGFINIFTDKVEEALLMAAEGVHT